MRRAFFVLAIKTVISLKPLLVETAPWSAVSASARFYSLLECANCVLSCCRWFNYVSDEVDTNQMSCIFYFVDNLLFAKITTIY